MRMNYQVCIRYIEVGQQTSIYKINLNKIVRDDIIKTKILQYAQSV